MTSDNFVMYQTLTPCILKVLCHLTELDSSGKIFHFDLTFPSVGKDGSRTAARNNTSGSRAIARKLRRKEQRSALGAMVPGPLRRKKKNNVRVLVNVTREDCPIVPVESSWNQPCP